MNHGHMRGNAVAFDLSTLGLLSKTLDNDKQHSLLHYILVLCKSKAPHAFQLPQLLRDLRAAAKVNADVLQSDVAALHAAIRQGFEYLGSLEAGVAAGEGKGGEGRGCIGEAGGREDGGGGGGHVQVLRGFLEATARELAEAEEHMQQMVASFKALLLYFGKREAEAEAEKLHGEQLFTLLVDFATDGFLVFGFV
jgi:hypothetical protein